MVLVGLLHERPGAQDRNWRERAPRDIGTPDRIEQQPDSLQPRLQPAATTSTETSTTTSLYLIL